MSDLSAERARIAAIKIEDYVDLLGRSAETRRDLRNFLQRAADLMDREAKRHDMTAKDHLLAAIDWHHYQATLAEVFDMPKLARHHEAVAMKIKQLLAGD